MGAVSTFTVTLRTNSTGAYRRLRRTLKTALRRDQLKAIDVREQTRASRRPPAQAVGAPGARRESETKMDMRKYSGAAFLKPGDVKAGPGPLEKVIDNVTLGKYGKPDLEFDDGTKLSINATNNKTLINAYGPSSDDWLNKKIELVVGETEYEGEPRESILIKPISPANEKKPKPKSSRGSDMDDEVPF